MKLHYLACALVLIAHPPAFAQIGGPRPSDQIALSEMESINERARARTAEALRRQEETARIAEQERRNREKAEREYASKREAARTAIRDLPETPDRQQQLDRFSCMYPPSATLPRTLQEVDSCMARLEQSRELVTRSAAAEQGRKAEQERKAEEQRKLQEELNATQERKAEEERSTKAAAEVAAQEAARAEGRDRIISRVAGVLGLAGVIALGVYRRKQGWASIAVAVVMGFLSGLLIYFMAVMLVTGKTFPLTTIFVVVTFFGGWALSMQLLLVGAVSPSKVLARGFLLGAAEWLTMIPVGVIFAGKAVSSTVATVGVSGASAAAVTTGAVIGGGIFAFLTGGLSVAMAILCLIGYAVTYFMTREMKPEVTTSTKKCPECAETIQAEARKCRYCGAELVGPRAAMSSSP